MKVKEFKIVEEIDDEGVYYQVYELKFFTLFWMLVDGSKIRSRDAAKIEEINLNKLHTCLVKWEFLDPTKDTNDWEV